MEEKKHDKKYEHHEKHHEEKHKKHEEHKHDKHKEKIKELENEIKKLQEDVLKAKADNINYRKRKDEEVSKILEYSNEDIVKDLLPIVDNFERAINLDDDNLDDELSKFLTGFKMIYCHVVEILEKYDVKPIGEKNEEFDPNIHQAVLTEKVEGLEPNKVVEVMQKGYKLKNKVIRPAMVKVSE